MEPLTAVPDEVKECRCVVRHNPLPNELHRHHVWPLGEGGPNTSENLRWLCPTTHSNVHRLWREYEKHGGAPPWLVRRAYSLYCRNVVDEGWRQADAYHLQKYGKTYAEYRENG